jgi:hypothetical protein
MLDHSPLTVPEPAFPLADLFDLTPLLWAGGCVLGAFTFYVLLLLPFCLARGEIGENARAVLRDLLGLFHALIEAVTARRGRS